MRITAIAQRKKKNGKKRIVTNTQKKRTNTCITMSKLICVDGNFGVMRAKKLNAKYKQTKIIKISQFKLRLPYTFRGVSRPSDVARPV